MGEIYMKKLSFFLLISLVLLIGCGNKNENISMDSTKQKVVATEGTIADISLKKNLNKNNNRIKEEILNKIEFINNNFQIGMNEVEVINLLGGTDYQIVKNDSEDGTYYDIKYQKYIKQPFTQKAVGTEIDIENIENGKIGLQIFIGMTKDKIAKRISMIYLENSKVMINFKSGNQEFIEPVLN